MTSEEDPITSKEELRSALTATLLRAHWNGITVEGGFECRNGSDHPEWDVVVTELEKKQPGD